MTDNDFDKQIREICDNVKWGRKYSRHDIHMIDQVVINGHEDESILNLSLYAYGRIHAVHSVGEYKQAQKSKHLLKHLKFEKPVYPKAAAVSALKWMKAVDRHWEFLVQECEREKAHFQSTANDDGHYDQFYEYLEGYVVEQMIKEDSEKLIQSSDLFRLVTKHKKSDLSASHQATLMERLYDAGSNRIAFNWNR